MNLDYSDEQILLRESADAFLRGTAIPEWSQLAELGWLGLPLPEEHGGFGQGAIDAGILTEAMGRHGARTPFVTNVALCGHLIAAIGNEAQRAALLTSLIAGERKFALAHEERGARGDLAFVETKATRRPEGWSLDGVKPIVADGGDADVFLITARTETGLGIFAIDRGMPGLSVEMKPALDGGTLAAIAMSDMPVSAEALLGDGRNCLTVLRRGIDLALSAWCFELVGLMESILAATLDHTRTRQQFGRPLAANQVVRHRIADLSIAHEEARALALRAALMLDSGHSDAEAATAGAKARIGKLARHAAQDAIQLHGAMGVTDELPLGNRLKRILAIEPLFGSPSDQLRRHASLRAEVF